MKANELMIGDWVECTYWTPSKQLKVAEIRRIIDDEIKIGVYCNDLVLIFRQSEVKPIPLTPEILKKNGFTEQRGSLYVIDKREEYIGLRLYRNSMRFTHEVYCSNVEDPDELLYSQELEFENCLYVHELQHLMRLCGIDKQIEL